MSSYLLLLGEEDPAEFVAQTLRFFFSRVIHGHHVGRHFLSALDGRIDAGKQDEFAIAGDHSLSVPGHCVFDIKPAGVWACRFGPQCQMIGIGEIFVERNIRDRPFILLDEFDVGDTDLGLPFDDSRRYRR